MPSPATVLLPGLLALLLAACAPREAPVQYKAEIQPILDRACAGCHVADQPGTVTSGLVLDSYEALMRGTRYGPVVKPGNPTESVLVMLIEGRADPSIKMPHGDQPPLYQGEIAKIRAWVEQGAKNN